MGKLVDVGQARARVESAKRELARAEGELEGFRRESEAAKVRLREALGCEVGGEKAALAELQAEVEAGEAEVASLLDAAEAAAREPEDAAQKPWPAGPAKRDA